MASGSSSVRSATRGLLQSRDSILFQWMVDQQSLCRCPRRVQVTFLRVETKSFTRRNLATLDPKSVMAAGRQMHFTFSILKQVLLSASPKDHELRVIQCGSATRSSSIQIGTVTSISMLTTCPTEKLYKSLETLFTMCVGQVPTTKGRSFMS